MSVVVVIVTGVILVVPTVGARLRVDILMVVGVDTFDERNVYSAPSHDMLESVR